MPTVYLIRHGETDMNGRCYAGRQDVPLNARGQQQAAEIADSIGSFQFDAILCSPLQRALATARPLSCKTGLDILIKPELLELDFGVLEGQSKANTSRSLRKDHLYEAIPGGESLRDVWLRTGRLAIDLKTWSDASSVAVFGHYWSNRMVFGQLNNLTLENAARQRAYRPELGNWQKMTTS